MKIALLSASFAVVSLAVAASYVLPSGSTLERAITVALAERPGLTDVCLFAYPINRVDITGAEAFGNIRKLLESRGVRLHVAGLKLPAQQVLERAGLLGTAPLLANYRTDAEALAALVAAKAATATTKAQA